MRQSAAPISMTATRRRFVQAALHFSPQTLHSCPRGQTPRPRGRQTPCTLIAETSGEADHPGPPDARRRPSFAHAPEPVRGPGGPDASPPPPPSNARALRGRQAFSSTSPPVSSYVRWTSSRRQPGEWCDDVRHGRALHGPIQGPYGVPRPSETISGQCTWTLHRHAV